MFGLFSGSSSTSQREKLEKQYQKLLTQAHELSHINRKKSDEKTAEAEDIRKQLDALDAEG